MKLVKVMKYRNILIIGLIVTGIFLSVAIQGLVQQHEKKAEGYLLEQKNPTTHDINAVLKYKNKYMGNASNIINLFNHLPLNYIERANRLYPDRYTAEMNYKETVFNIGGDKVNKALIYNSVVAFALIDNLEGIHYNFVEKSYTTTRSNIEEIFGKNLPELLTEGRWKEEVQNKLKDKDFVNTCMEKAFSKNNKN